MCAPNVEIMLARLYTDSNYLQAFIDNSEKIVAEIELTDSEKVSLLAMDKSELKLAANSFAIKRQRG